jgi:hypothetical protein
LGFKNGLLKFNKGLKKTKILIGADGPLSAVARSSGLFKNKKFVVCLQARVKGNFDKERMSGYLYKNYCAAVIPENDRIAKINVIAKKSMNIVFRNFIKKFKGRI